MGSVTRTPIPITVFTGFLGAGKTSIILSLLPQLPEDYKVVLLKNEFGDVEVDSKLAQQSSLTAVSEILNGCMCCVLVGQMQTALLEIRDNFRPDRIIIECSGSAFPATLAFQIRELERETHGDFTLDAIVTVIDAENFSGYEDTSPTAKMQASYTDIILVNKWEHVTERALDFVLDHLNTLNDQTPKIKTKDRSVDPNLIFGIETKLFLDKANHPLADYTHNDEVQTLLLTRGHPPNAVHDHANHTDLGNPCACNGETAPSTNNTDNSHPPSDENPISRQDLLSALDALSKETVWRVKGFVRLLNDGEHMPVVPLASQTFILNWAFGRYELTPRDSHSDLCPREVIKLTAMGERGELKRALRKFCGILGVQLT